MSSKPGRRWKNPKPCGTDAAYRRHLRRKEKPCAACAAANRRRLCRRGGWEAGALSPDTREPRNGLPEYAGYRYRARRYPWAVRVLANAEATWGRPDEEEAA